MSNMSAAGSGGAKSNYETRSLEVTVAIVDADERLYDSAAKGQRRKHTSTVKTRNGKAVWREALLLQNVSSDKELLLTVFEKASKLTSRKPLGSVRIPIPEIYPMFRECHTAAAKLDPFYRAVAEAMRRRRKILARLNRKFESKFVEDEEDETADEVDNDIMSSHGLKLARRKTSVWKPDGEGNETFEEEDDGDLEAGDGEEVVNPEDQEGGEDEKLDLPTNMKQRDRAKSTKYHTVWQPDDEATNCHVCGDGFSLMRRRHHCRRCGKVVHGSCSTSRRKVYGSNNAKRVCDKCLDLPDDDDEEDPFFGRDRESSLGSVMSVQDAQDAIALNKPAYHPALSPQHEGENASAVLSSPTRSDQASLPRKKTVGVSFAMNEPQAKEKREEKPSIEAQWFPLLLELELPVGSGADKVSLSDSIAQIKTKLCGSTEGLMGASPDDIKFCQPGAGWEDEEARSDAWWSDDRTLEACLEDVAGEGGFTEHNPDTVRIDCQVGRREIQFSATLISGRNDIPSSLLRL
jgi:hypothetical protein